MDTYTNSETKTTTEEYGEQLLSDASESIIENAGFMEAALDRINLVAKRGVGTASLVGDDFYYEPSFLLKKCVADDNYPVRLLLHSLWHAVFAHGYSGEKMNEEYWDLACDIAVENLIMELGIADFSLAIDNEIRDYLEEIKTYSAGMTAEKLYRFLLANPPSSGVISEYTRLFSRDDHSVWRQPQNPDMNREEWIRISDRIKIELKIFAKSTGHAESLIGNLDEATRQRYDYKKLLERFCLDSENISVSEDEFDYVYYTFGLTTYDGMPFIEPLELTKGRHVRDYVIVLDVSVFCRVEIIRSFLQKTYDIIKYMDEYAEAINLHIVRCDNEESAHTVIRSQSELDSFVDSLELNDREDGDYRPAFAYVDKLLYERVFTDFRGVIYFTDERGIFPGKNPGYECIYAYFSVESSLPEVPWWATPILLDEDSLQM